MKYRKIQGLHLGFGLTALPFLLMYGLTAVQMAHTHWFHLTSEVNEWRIQLVPGIRDAAGLVWRVNLKGNVTDLGTADGLLRLRIQLPGTVHEIRYSAKTGDTAIRTSRSDAMGKLNRLHHAAGLWPDYFPLQIWGAMIGIVSLAMLGLVLTGIPMWWMRGQDRMLGAGLAAGNVIFAIVVLTLMRMKGP